MIISILQNRLLVFLLLLVFIAFPKSYGQQIIDDFETGSLINWELIQGKAGTISNPVFNGASAAVLGIPDMDDATTVITHRSFQDDYGTYEMQCRADGPVSDIYFFFQYLDSLNFYLVTCKPLATDNPELTLEKRVNGNTTIIAQIPPIFGLNTWFSLKVERNCASEILVYINNDLQISTTDDDINTPGTVGLGAWAESTYFDDVTFQSSEPAYLLHISDTICQSERYFVGDTSYALEGFYADTLQTSQGCDSIIHLNLSVTPAYLVYLRDTICTGEYVILGVDTIRTAGLHTRNLLSSAGCDSIVELSLLLRNPPTFQLGDDFGICFDEIPGVELSVDGFSSYLWSDNSTFASLFIQNPGTYWLEGSDGVCSARDTIMIQNVCGAKLYIPNAFSPNNDGVNDEFKVQTTEFLSFFDLKIFNRWGNFIFHTSNPNQGWDGTWNNEKQETGVYVWILETENGIQKGDLTLVR